MVGEIHVVWHIVVKMHLVTTTSTAFHEPILGLFHLYVIVQEVLLAHTILVSIFRHF